MAIQGGLPALGGFPGFGGGGGFPGQQGGGFPGFGGGGLPGQPGGGGIVPFPQQQNQQQFLELATAAGLGDVRVQTLQTLKESTDQGKQAMDRFKQGSSGQGGGN